jgi:hypothetical protein
MKAGLIARIFRPGRRTAIEKRNKKVAQSRIRM